MKNLGWILLIGIGIWILTKVRAGQSLNFAPRGLSFDGVNLILTLGVINSSSFPISFQSFQGSVSANNVNLGTVQDLQPSTIAANTESQVQLILVPNLSNIITLIKNIWNSSTAQNLTLDGQLQAENLTIPVHTVFETIPAIA